MTRKGVNRGLGKGLQALIPDLGKDSNLSQATGGVKEMALARIEPNRRQPRKNFDQKALDELAASIDAHGVIQPLVVRPIDQGRYQLIVGERRWRACRQLGLEKVPVVIKDWDDRKTAEVCLIENIQRQDLNPLEEAVALRALIEEFQLTQEQVARQVGKSRSYIANAQRLLQLSATVQGMIADGRLSTGHAKVILSVVDPGRQEELAAEVIANGWTVRQTEAAVRRQAAPESPASIPDGEQAKTKSRETDPFLTMLEERLRSSLKTRVKVRNSGDQGQIEISYYSEDDLQRIVEILFPGTP
ncbi:MAG: ParB/RepB/Spo0J family partition protein [Heliobacteriaceae bacterium]|nr:ParB/RepB/Spo0J family partition protein [Heliobacteriaceae bacterium]MDD4587677.1 ParB/RepB/Spo0J family partition protein [Heliobacteriaceae bacterium]